MRSQYSWDDFGRSLRQGHIPVTKGIVAVSAAMLVFFLAIAKTSAFATFHELVAFQSSLWLTHPWTAATYPFMPQQRVFGMLLYGLMMWWFGGSLERSWGSRVFAWFFFIISAISAVCLWIAATLTGAPVVLTGLGMPIASITVAWASLNPEAVMLLFFVLPVRAKYVGWATAALVAANYALGYPSPANIVMMIFGLSGCLAAWRYVRYREETPRSRTPVIRLHRRRFRLPNPFRARKEKRDSERLRRLFGEDKDDKEHWR